MGEYPVSTLAPQAPIATPAEAGDRTARRVQVLSLLSVVPLLAVFLFQHRAVFRAELLQALPDATGQETALGVWSALAAGVFFNLLVYTAMVFGLGALAATACRAAGATAGFRPLRQTLGAVLAAYFVLRTTVFVLLSCTGLAGRELLSWLPRPDPGLLALAVLTTLVLRRRAPELGPVRTALCALAPALLLGLLQAVL
ncbi:hypothetical protein [Streptomyces pratensis]|uniref:hypothetical protein n=1 Tax=Streptomyces pratensis TaxID=1169025 RepID=UPI00301B5231